MAKLRFLVNEGDDTLSALYVDNKLKLKSDIDWGMQVEDLLPALVGLTIESVTIENTNLPFFDDDENALDPQEWPATIEELTEDEG